MEAVRFSTIANNVPRQLFYNSQTNRKEPYSLIYRVTTTLTKYELYVTNADW